MKVYQRYFQEKTENFTINGLSLKQRLEEVHQEEGNDLEGRSKNAKRNGGQRNYKHVDNRKHTLYKSTSGR